MGLRQWLVKGRLFMGFLSLGMGNKLQVDLLSFPRLLVRSSVDRLMGGWGLPGPQPGHREWRNPFP